MRWLRTGKRPKLEAFRSGCKVRGCKETKHKARGYCNKHYTRWRRYGDVTVCKKTPKQGTCKICSKRRYARGLCWGHWLWAKQNEGHEAKRRPRFPAQPIIDLLNLEAENRGVPVKWVYEDCGLNWKSIRTMDTLTDLVIDKVTTHMGLHPLMLYPNYNKDAA